MVGSRVERHGGEEAVVEERAFEEGVDEEIEGVPDEKDSQSARGGGVEDLAGETVGGIEDHENGQETDGGRAVDVFQD